MTSGRGGTAAAMAQNEQTTEEHSTPFRRLFVLRHRYAGSVNQGPDLQNILRFIIRLSQVYRKIDLR